MLVRMHERMQAHVLHTGRLRATVPMRTGVRQGSVEGPTLYLFFYTLFLPNGADGVGSNMARLMVLSGFLLAMALSASLRALAGHNGTLSVLRTSRTRTTHLLVDTDWDRFSFSANTLDTVLCEFGVDMNLTKTEWMMVFGCDKFPDQAPLPGARQLFIRGMPVPRTNLFKYLGVPTPLLGSMQMSSVASALPGPRSCLVHFEFSCLTLLHFSGAAVRV